MESSCLMQEKPISPGRKDDYANHQNIKKEIEGDSLQCGYNSAPIEELFIKVEPDFSKVAECVESQVKIRHLTKSGHDSLIESGGYNKSSLEFVSEQGTSHLLEGCSSAHGSTFGKGITDKYPFVLDHTRKQPQSLLTSHNSSTFVHSVGKPNTCRLCSYASDDDVEFVMHSVAHTEGKLFICEECSYSSDRKANLNRHYLIHTGEKPFACHMCDFKTRERSKLNRHFNTHQGVKAFACDFCCYRTNDRTSLNRHTNIHSGLKPFACHECTFKTNDKTRLKKHIMRHTGLKPFGCELCSFRTTDNSRLQKHILKHNGEKPYQCEICSFKTNIKYSLKRHLSTHKPVTNPTGVVSRNAV